MPCVYALVFCAFFDIGSFIITFIYLITSRGFGVLGKFYLIYFNLIT